MWRAGIAVALVAAVVWAQPSRVGCGPGQAGCGPAIVLGGSVTTTTLPLVVLPVAGNADVNCPTTIPTQNSTTASINVLTASQTCATGANPSGYDVVSFSLYLGTTFAGNHLQCSVWLYPVGYAPGVTAVPKVAAGCDSAVWTVTTTPNAFITMAIPGPCHLAPATRYFLGCNTDNTGSGGSLIGYNTTSCTNCQQQTFIAYPGLLDPWTAVNQASTAMAYYVKVTPSP